MNKPKMSDKKSIFWFYLVMICILFFFVYEYVTISKQINASRVPIEISADLRSITSSLETYKYDHGHYPEMMEDCSVPDYIEAPYHKELYEEYPLRYYYFKNRDMYILQCAGLDNDYDIPTSFLIESAQKDRNWIRENLNQYRYDRTNGPYSSGDIFRTSY